MTPTSSDDVLADPIGRFPQATVACFDPTKGDLPRRQLDEKRTVQFLERLASAGAPAVLIAASTGHGHVRTVDELAQWFRCAAQANLGGTVKTALLRPEDGHEANGRLLDLLRDLHYPIVFFRPGTNLPPTADDRQVAGNLSPLVAAAAERGFAVGVYSIPDVSGVKLTAAATVMLLQGDGGTRIVAAKVTEANYDDSTLQFLRHPELRRLKIVQGWDPYLARALQDGPHHDADGRQRCGVTSGPMSFAVHQYTHILLAAHHQNWAEVEAAQAAVTALFQSMQDDPRKVADLQRAKLLMGLGQPLTGTVQLTQVERVLSALEALPRAEDRARLARSLDLMGDGPYHARLMQIDNG